MKFGVEQKGEKYLVVNEDTGYVKGVHRTKGEAEVQAEYLQKEHDKGIEQVSARMTKPAATSEEGPSQ